MRAYRKRQVAPENNRSPACPRAARSIAGAPYNPDFRREYEIACQLRTDGYLEETIDIIDDKKEIVTETITKDEDGTERVSKAFSKEAVAYALARINIRYSTIGKTLPRKCGKKTTAWASLRPSRRATAAPRRTWAT